MNCICPYLGFSSERELPLPVALPNKNGNVRTKTETNEHGIAQSVRLKFYCGVRLV
jgi:hypothetical protein